MKCYSELNNGFYNSTLSVWNTEYVALLAMVIFLSESLTFRAYINSNFRTYLIKSAEEVDGHELPSCKDLTIKNYIYRDGKTFDPTTLGGRNYICCCGVAWSST